MYGLQWVIGSQYLHFSDNGKKVSGTIAEDEADDIDETHDKMKVYKNGSRKGKPYREILQISCIKLHIKRFIYNYLFSCIMNMSTKIRVTIFVFVGLIMCSSATSEHEFGLDEV